MSWRIVTQLALFLGVSSFILGAVAFSRGQLDRDGLIGIGLVAVLTILNAGVGDTFRALRSRAPGRGEAGR